MTESKYSRIKYPLQITAKLTSSENGTMKSFSTFSVETSFNPPDIFPEDSYEKADSPLEGFDSKSLYKLSIIHKVEKDGKTIGTTYPSGNIRVDEIAGIKAKSDATLQVEMLMQSNWGKNVTYSLKANSTEINKIISVLKGMGKYLKVLPSLIKSGKTIQQTQTKSTQTPSIDVEVLKAKATGCSFMVGHLKDKTPLQVILEDSEKGKSSLEQQKEFLEKNLAKYPKNKNLIDAIDAALTLLSLGALKDNSGSDIIPSDVNNNQGSVEIYSATPRALIRKKDPATGLCPVYEVSIIWHYGNRYPIEVSIVNEKAPVTQKANGQITPILSKKQDVVKESFRMSIDDWYDILDRMVDVQKNFKQMYFATMYKQAQNALFENRKAASVASKES